MRLIAKHEVRAVLPLLPLPDPRSLICGSGEMVDRIRAHPWRDTPLGLIERWPDALLITVNLLLASRQPMFLWWGDGLIQFYNDAYRPSLGADKHPGCLGQRAVQCWPEIWPLIWPQIQASMSDGEPSWNEDQLVPILRNGKLEDVYWTYGYSPVRDARGTICGTLVTCFETTGKVLEADRLRKERARLSALFEQAPAFCAVLRGPNHIFEMTNPSYQALIGNRSVLGKPVREAVPESEEQGFLHMLDRVYRTGEAIVGHRTRIHLARAGSEVLDERFLNFVYQPMREADDAISGIIVLGVDVTEGKRAEQVLLQTEKLAAVGRLASSLAHEINNPLEAITNLLYLARNSEDLPEIQQYLDTAERELRRVSVISNQTLRFHKQATHPTVADFDGLADSIFSIYHARISNAGIHVEHRRASLSPVICFEGEIRQVLLNLMGNAIDAMHARGGRLLFRSHQSTNWKAGEQGVRLVVADTGSGISPHAAQQIFEPFFTTKGAAGTGLGLWISKEIIARHQGILAVRSSQDLARSGTVFTLWLPLHCAAAGPVQEV